jgi:hypothetical protein
MADAPVARAAFFRAFFANNVQHRKADLKAAVFRGADGIRTILRLAEALGPTGSPITEAAVGYTQSVLTKRMADYAEGGAEHLKTAAHQATLDGLVEVRKARLERLTLTVGVSDPMSWLAMLVLGVLTQIAVAVVQLERLRPQALALFVFTTAFAATVVLIGLARNPFSGEEIRNRCRAAVASAVP